MSPRKLTKSNKQEILELYRNTPETTSTLADRYGVSSSTISRFLKSSLSETEYEDLIQQKRLGRTPGRKNAEATKSQSQTPTKPKKAAVLKQRQSVSASQLEAETEHSSLPNKVSGDLTLKTTPREDLPEEEEQDTSEYDRELEQVNVATLKEMLGEDLADLDEDDRLEESEDEDWEEEEVALPRTTSNKTELQVLPLSEASFPKICYLVTDRAADLITKPLRDFADLGKIPATEIGQKTLPIFDNQRVAKRFSNRYQRVIKIPNGGLLKETAYHLQAKGITRLLFDGKVYSLSLA